ncbi:rod shape-determining protein RodA [Candidatus Poribacteria bacterium]|nr:rod shape-determining protein RodA [Candidatus Poribacteria bacterium]
MNIAKNTKTKIKEFDLVLLYVTLGISIIGVFMVFSAVHSGSKSDDGLWISQLIRLIIAIAAMAVAILVDYRIWHTFAYILYGIWAVLLSVLLAFPIQSGVRRWFMKGAIQPSELAKIILIIALARFLSDRKKTAMDFKTFVYAMIIVLAYVLLIFMQPSLGYALTLIPIALVMFYIGGINVIHLLLLIIPGLVAAGSTIIILYERWDVASSQAIIKIVIFLVSYILLSLLAYFIISKTRIRDGKKWVRLVAFCIIVGLAVSIIGTGVLKDYQKKRLMAFVNPGSDSKGSGYHIIQSKIAIGSGGVIGQGYLQGTQNRLDFLPAQHTDFIFSVLSEEIGFIGVIIVFLLYLVLISNGLKAIARADDAFGTLLATGIVTMIATQIFLNLGMTIGYMPITGVPLPLMSYGGSSLVATFISIGLMLNVRLKRQ